MFKREVKALLKKEWRIEWRQSSTFSGLVLYVFSTAFIVYLGMKEVHPIVWNVLFWILMLFNAVHAMAKSFMQEEEGVNLFLYTQVSAISVILAKMIYNSALLLVLASLCFTFYSVIMGNPVKDIGMFVLNLSVGSIGFAVVLTFIAALSSKSTNKTGLMAILGIPLIVPLLIMVVKVSKNAMDGLDRSISVMPILTVVAMIIAFFLSSVLLFRHLWTE